MARKIVVTVPVLILVLLLARFRLKPFADWIIETGMPAHIGFTVVNLGLVGLGVGAATQAAGAKKYKVGYAVLLLLFFASMGASHMSSESAVGHTIGNVGMIIFPILAAVLALTGL